MRRALVVLVLVGALALMLGGCSIDTLLEGMVNRAPRAVIDAKPAQGPAPLAVTLDAHYSHDDDGALVETRWDLGDPAATGSRLESSLTHEYKTPGTYIVKLTVTDNEGAMNGQQLAIVVTNPPRSPSQALTTRRHTLEMRSSSTDLRRATRSARSSSHRWDFGDGETADIAKPKHTYKNGGDYVATLTVTDDGGPSASAKLTIPVQPGSSNCGGRGTCGGNDVKPLAVITIPYGYTSCSGGTVGVPLTFDGTASRAASGSITLYQWDFGDGTTASGAVVQHTYTTAWRYTVRLTVTDSGGAVGVAQGVCSIGGAGGCTSQ